MNNLFNSGYGRLMSGADAQKASESALVIIKANAESDAAYAAKRKACDEAATELHRATYRLALRADTPQYLLTAINDYRVALHNVTEG